MSKKNNGKQVALKDLKVEFTFDVIVDGNKKRKKFWATDYKTAETELHKIFGDDVEIDRWFIYKMPHAFGKSSTDIADEFEFPKAIDEKLRSLEHTHIWWSKLNVSEQDRIARELLRQSGGQKSHGRVVRALSERNGTRKPGQSKSAKLRVIKSKKDADNLILWLTQNDGVDDLMGYALERDDDNVPVSLNVDDESKPLNASYVFGARKHINEWIREQTG